MKSPNIYVPSSTRSLLWQEVENLDEQRRYPKIPLNIDMGFITDTGIKFSAELINISPDGLQIRCSEDSAQLIRPQVRKIDAPFVYAAISLPVGHGSRTLAIRCQTLYLRTVDTEPRCVVGMRFFLLDLQSECNLNAFFADQLMYEAPHAEVA